MIGIIRAPEKLWSRPSVHCAFDHLQSVDLAFCLTVAPGQAEGVTDGVDITAKYPIAQNRMMIGNRKW